MANTRAWLFLDNVNLIAVNLVGGPYESLHEALIKQQGNTLRCYEGGLQISEMDAAPILFQATLAFAKMAVREWEVPEVVQLWLDSGDEQYRNEAWVLAYDAHGHDRIHGQVIKEVIAGITSGNVKIAEVAALAMDHALAVCQIYEPIEEVLQSLFTQYMHNLTHDADNS